MNYRQIKMHQSPNVLKLNRRKIKVTPPDGYAYI